MTEWGIDTLFNPGKRHMDEEKRRLQSTREEVGDSSGGGGSTWSPAWCGSPAPRTGRGRRRQAETGDAETDDTETDDTEAAAPRLMTLNRASRPSTGRGTGPTPAGQLIALSDKQILAGPDDHARGGPHRAQGVHHRQCTKYQAR